MFTLTAPQLGRELVNERVRRAAERGRLTRDRAHEVQRERVRASLLLRPEPDAGSRWRG
jgi:hypothetical protein